MRREEEREGKRKREGKREREKSGEEKKREREKKDRQEDTMVKKLITRVLRLQCLSASLDNVEINFNTEPCFH
jgi:hypothetical protein